VRWNLKSTTIFWTIARPGPDSGPTAPVAGADALITIGTSQVCGRQPDPVAATGASRDHQSGRHAVRPDGDAVLQEPIGEVLRSSWLTSWS
jgi:hypothetical protein